MVAVEVMTPDYCRSFHLSHCRSNPGLVKIHLENIQSLSFLIWKCEYKGGGVSTKALEGSPHSDKGCGDRTEILPISQRIVREGEKSGRKQPESINKAGFSAGDSSTDRREGQLQVSLRGT